MLSGFLLLFSALILRHLSYMERAQWNCSGVPSSKKALVLEHGICDDIALSVVVRCTFDSIDSSKLFAAGPHSTLSLSLVFCSSTSTTTATSGGCQQGRAEPAERWLSVDGDSTSDDPAEEKSDRRHDPHTTLGTADTVGELGLAELRRGSAMETAGLL